ncbi:MAG: ATPase, T2SS/T4P/T4SS family [Bacteroidota bacterium]
MSPPQNNQQPLPVPPPEFPQGGEEQHFPQEGMMPINMNVPQQMYPQGADQHHFSQGGMMPMNMNVPQQMYPQGAGQQQFPQGGMIPADMNVPQQMYPQGNMMGQTGMNYPSESPPVQLNPAFFPQEPITNQFPQDQTATLQTATIETPVNQRLKETKEAEYAKLNLKEEEVLPKNPDGSPDIVKLINNLFLLAKQYRASDIHIEPREEDIAVRFRIDGDFHEYYTFSKNLQQPIITRVMVIAGLKIDEMRLPQDGKIILKYEDKEIDMRVSTFPIIYGNKIALRLLEKESKAKTLEELGYSGRPLQIINKNLTRTYGMILMTGPTGSGKSTTLFSMLSTYNPFKYNISTLEDPVEYIIKGANQAQVRADIGFDFPDGLRTLVRQDPDIIMIGEIRDKITANLAVQAALTGHLVFSTLHANSASGTIQRLANMEVDSFLAGAALNIIVSQRLVRRNCEFCKKPYTPPSDQVSAIRDMFRIFPQLSSMQFIKSEGCEKCNYVGYKGRIAIFEVLPVSPMIQKAIIENPVASYVESIAMREGMMTIKQNGLIAVMQGHTTLEEILIAVDASRMSA